MSPTTTSAELVVEDLLLVLFDERHHVFRGEGQRLFHALAAGAAPLMHPEIPWSGAVHAHGTELVSASRAATGTAEVVHQTIATLVSTSVFVSLAAGARD